MITACLLVLSALSSAQQGNATHTVTQQSGPGGRIVAALRESGPQAAADLIRSWPAQSPSGQAYLPPQTLGKADTKGKDTYGRSWFPASHGTLHWIRLGFDRATNATAIRIHGTYGQDAVYRLRARDSDGRFVDVSRRLPDLVSLKDGVGSTTIMLRTPLKVSEVELYIDTSLISGMNVVDAVALLDGKREVAWANRVATSSARRPTGLSVLGEGDTPNELDIEVAVDKLIHGERADEAVNLAHVSVALNGESPRAHATVGRALLAAERPKEALESLEHAHEMCPWNADLVQVVNAVRATQSLSPLPPPVHDMAILRAAVTEVVEAGLNDPSPGLAITVIHGGKTVWFEGFGVKDRVTREPITEDTTFAIASISKTVAAWGFMQLVESEVITLDEPVLDHLEHWKPRKLRKLQDGITLRRLLSHTAGLSVHGVEGVAHGRRVPTLLDAIKGTPRGFRRVDLVQPPGEGFRYSGGGTSLAQLLYEQKTGRSFAHGIQANVLTPLGMNSSGFHWNAELVAASATPYMPSKNVTARLDYPQTAPAGFVTTSRDFARFAIACMPDFRPPEAEAVLSRKWLEAMQARSPDATHMGLGFFHKRINGLPTVGHTGGDHGWTSALRIAPETGDALLVFQNCYSAEDLSRQVESVWAAWIRGTLR